MNLEVPEPAECHHNTTELAIELLNLINLRRFEFLRLGKALILLIHVHPVHHDRQVASSIECLVEQPLLTVLRMQRLKKFMQVKRQLMLAERLVRNVLQRGALLKIAVTRGI